MDVKKLKCIFMIINCLIIALFCPLLKSVFAKEWNGIIPLKSTRSDVEKLLGPPRKEGGYKLADKFVSFFYSECESHTHCECIVSKDTVIKIEVYLHYELKLDDLNLNLKKFKKKTSEHLLVYDSYSNFEEGIIYNVFNEDNTVKSITYLPSEKDCEELVGKIK